MKTTQLNIKEILSTVSSKEDLMKTREEEAKLWLEENGHLLEEVLEPMDIGTRDSILIKEWYYNVEGTNTGRRIAPKFNKDVEAHTVSKADVVEDEMVVDSWKTEKGFEVKIYDRGGLFGAQFKRYQESITSGEYSQCFRNSHFEDGLCPGEFHAVDERGNNLGFMSTAEYKAWERQVEAEVRADVEYLEKRSGNRRDKEVEMRDYARKVYMMIYNRIVNQLDNYGDIKRLIYKSQRLVLKALKRRYPEKITRKGGIYIYQPVRYGTNDANMENMNILFHKVESNKLWKAVDESKWKQNRLGKLDAAREKYNKLMRSLDITNNPYDKAELISEGKIGLSKQDASDILGYVSSKTNQDRLAYPVYKAVRSIAA